MKKGFAERSDGAEARQPSRSKQPKKLTTEEMEAEGIFMLKQKSTRFPDAIAYCRVCEYHVHCLEQHLKHADHKKAKMERKRVARLGHLPDPIPVHSTALTILVEGIAKTHGRPVEHLLALSNFAETLTASLQSFIHLDCHVRIYGSCQTGMALRTSNLNLELVYPEKDVNHSTALTAALKFLLSSDDFTNVTPNFQSMWPSVAFCSRSLTDVGSPLCVLSVRNSQAYEIGRLLRVYIDFRPQLAILGQALRYWARVCKLDDGMAGGLPPYAFDLMLVHFLQQIDYLPVLHEMIPKSETEPKSPDGSDCPYQRDFTVISQAFKGSNDWNLGEMWWRFFKFYTLMCDNHESVVQIRRKAPVDRDEKNWTKKRIAIEDPFLPMKNLAQFSQAMYDYFANCLQTTFVYFVIPRTLTGAMFQFEAFIQQHAPQPSSPTVTTKSRLLNDRPQEREINAIELDVGAVQAGDQPPQQRSPPTDKRESAPSPTAHDSSSCGYTSAFMRQLAMTPLANCPLSHEAEAQCERAGILSPNHSGCDDRAYKTDFCEAAAHSLTQPPPCAYADQKEVEEVSVANVRTETDAHEDESDEEDEHSGADVVVLEDDEEANDEQASGSVDVSANSPSPSPVGDQLVDMNEIGEKLAAMTIGDFHYDFNENCLCGDLIAEVTCLYCTTVGHREADCLEKKLPEIIPLSPMTREFHDDTEFMLLDVFNANKITKYQIDFMEQLRLSLLAKLEANLFKGNCRLDLFGSARNGFGFCYSDIDLCLRFNEDHLPLSIDPKIVIQQCADLLVRDRDFYDVVPITAAKVPIVKFKHYWQTVEGDISLYNVLALRNTEMLRTYAMMDERVQILGIFVKSWAKHCDIGDASKGSLSSYSFIIMLIHYLQRCDPPVLPVLQEMDNEDGSKSVVIDGWNTYFFSDFNVLRTWSRNRQSVAQLWLGFLCYYAEQKFNPGLDVVQIRQTKALSKFDKLWTGKSLAIEDPFDLNHNLAAGLGKRMFSYVWRCLIHSRWAFGNPDSYRRFLRDWQVPSVRNYVPGVEFGYYMLEESRLKEDPPRDRVCRICGTVGHYAEGCPRNRRNRAAAKRDHDAQLNHYQNHQRYVNDRRSSTSNSDPQKRPTASRSYRGVSHNVDNSRRGDNNFAQQSSPSQLEERLSTTEDKSTSRKERRQRKADARELVNQLNQSHTPSSTEDGAIDEEQMTAALGITFVKSVDAFAPRMPLKHNRGRGGGYAPTVFSSHPRGYQHPAPRWVPQQQHSVPQQLSDSAGCSKSTSAVSVAQSPSAAVSTASHDVPAVISAPPGAAKGKSRSWKQSSPPKRNSPADSAAAPSAAVHRQRKQLATGPPGWNARQGMKGGMGRGQVVDAWKDE